MKKEIIKTDEIVILIDADYLETVGRSMNEYFSHIVKRKLPKADMPALVEGIALDAGIRPGEHQVQVFFIYSPAMKRFSFCEPSRLDEELDSVAFRSNMGEFTFNTFSTEGLAAREEMVSDFLQALSVSENTRDVIVVGRLADYGKDAVKALEAARERDVFYFDMDPREGEKYPALVFCNLGFSLLHSMGVRPEELD